MVVAVAKNADNVWGEPTIVRYTTPAVASEAPAQHKAPSVVGNVDIKTRINPVRRNNVPGMAPVLNKFNLSK